MKAYVSLHTRPPQAQLDGEVFYQGYKRVEVEFGDDLLSGDRMANVQFPVIEADSDDVVTFIAIGACETGQGDLFMIIPALPHIALQTEPARLTKEYWLAAGAAEKDVDLMIENYGYIAPKVVIANLSPTKLPDNLNPIAREAHRLVHCGLMRTSDLHPKMFEAINNVLADAGVPVLTVIRGGAAKFDVKMSQLPSLSEFATEGVH